MNQQTAPAADLVTWVSNGIAQQVAAVQRGLLPAHWRYPTVRNAEAILRFLAADSDMLKQHGAVAHLCDQDYDGPDLHHDTRIFAYEACPVLRELANGYGWTATGGQIQCGWNPIAATTDCDWEPTCPVHGYGGHP